MQQVVQPWRYHTINRRVKPKCTTTMCCRLAELAKKQTKADKRRINRSDGTSIKSSPDFRISHVREFLSQGMSGCGQIRCKNGPHPLILNPHPAPEANILIGGNEQNVLLLREILTYRGTAVLAQSQFPNSYM